MTIKKRLMQDDDGVHMMCLQPSSDGETAMCPGELLFKKVVKEHGDDAMLHVCTVCGKSETFYSVYPRTKL